MSNAPPAAVPQYLADLNPEQRAAAMTTEGPVLVLAGAGSGKTRMLVYRIVHLLQTGVDPRKILAVTFTNRAATEMRERVKLAAGRRAKGTTLSTFHSLGARILREFGTRIDLPERFAIYSTGDQLALLRRILTEEVHVAATVGEENYDVKRVLFQISSWKNQLTGPDDARQQVADGRMRDSRVDDYAILAADAYPRYEESLRAAGACDFDDLLLLSVSLLRDHDEVREALWRRWHYVMVDEYQDTNAAQLEMARLIAGPRRNLCVVGDDDQSIYAGRGADLSNILEFERQFAGARVIILDQNYRSSQRILNAANSVIANNTLRKVKSMRTGNGLGPKIDYFEFDREGARTAEENEAAMVAREIGVRRFHEGLKWKDFAVLYRANHQSRVIEEALRQANVPYRVIGGTSYFDRKEIADAAAYLRVLLNPRDDISMRRIINYPTRGIGRTTLLRLVDAARSRRVPISAVLEGAGEIEGISRAQTEAIARFNAIVESARLGLGRAEEEAVRSAAPGALAGWMEEFFREIGLEAAIRDEAKGEKSMEIRIDNLRDFVASVAAYERRIWSEMPLPDEEVEWAPPSIHGFLQGVSLYAEEDSNRDKEDDADQASLLTLHSAKGLEFVHVFLVGLEEEILPHARSIQGISDGTTQDPIAEERRLFYVGITRARHRLTLSGCRTRRRSSEWMPRQPSRFLQEIPADLLEMRTAAPDTTSLTETDRSALKKNFFAHMKEMLE